jgi:hypothetical protein
MRIIPFPQPAGAPGEPTLAEIEAALHGDAVGPSAEYWRDVRADVRALAPPLPPELEARLRERIEQRAVATSGRAPGESRARGLRSRVRTRWQSRRYVRVLVVLGPVLAAAIVTLALIDPWNTAPALRQNLFAPQAAIHREAQLGPAAPSVSGGSAVAGSASGSAAAATVHTTPTQVAPAEASPRTAARIQQRAASLTLASKPSEVQSVSDRVAQLAVREGGFVQSSQVHLERGTAGEASLRLSLPSAHLSAALASLARLAPTRAESQSQQDITDEYDAAQRKLADAVAERQALLRALSRASTQGEIESLHARLALAGGAITRARESFQSVSRRGSSSSVEVSVIGDAHAASGGGLSLSRALHDAGDVLRVSLAVLLIALAALVPLAILGGLLALGWRAGRRRLRERALS